MDMLGLYPQWVEAGVGSGWVIGIIATIHVLASHTSVGAAIFFAGLAVYADRKDKPHLLEFIRRYGLFLLIFSYVIGSITGPGIWYSTTVGSPRGISALIHAFVWKWATEWVFFVIEVVGVYILVYLAGKIDRKTHLRIAIIFGLTSYTTMLVIIGILSFMLWPGQPEWFTEGGYLNGFYGANTFSHLAIRTFFMFTMMAVVGGIVASRFEDLQAKREIVRILSWIGIVATSLGAISLLWYLQTLPHTAHLILENRLPESFKPAMGLVILGIVGYFVWFLWKPTRLGPVVASVATVSILIFGLWPEEVARESIRKPYVAGQYVYSNQVIARDVPGLGVKSEMPLLEEKGFLQAHIFTPEQLRTPTTANLKEAGHFLAVTACSNCHSVTATGMRPLKNYIGEGVTVPHVQRYLHAALGSGNTLYMPKIPLTDKESEALAVYLVDLVNPKTAQAYLDLATSTAAAASPASPAASIK